MPEEHTIVRSPSKTVWIIAYLLCPALPFFCLRYARAIGTVECIVGVIAALTAHIGLVTVLGATDGNSLQIFVILLMGAFASSVVMSLAVSRRLAFQACGDQQMAQKQWRTAGRFFGGFLAVGMALAIPMSFHLRRNLGSGEPLRDQESPSRTSREWQPAITLPI